MSVAPTNTAAIDFSSIATGSYQTVTVGDYVFSRINGEPIYVFDGISGRSLGDTQREIRNDQGSVFTISRTDGLSFTVESLVFVFTRGGGGIISLGNYDENTTKLFRLDNDGIVYNGERDILTNTSSLFADIFSYNAGGVGLLNLSISSIPVTSAVPEPATWAMLLVGFGMIGATARYRRRAPKIVYA